MPPKAKLHKNSGKPKTLPQMPLTEPSTSNQNPLMDNEMARQFEIELCWCIQQLQTALKNVKLNPKQIQDHTKSLNTLMSNSAPLIQKRQVMRLSFGDYRAKMAAEEKKFKSVNMKVNLQTKSPNKNSMFIKKSTFASTSGNHFKFNFEPPTPEDVANNISVISLENQIENNMTINGDVANITNTEFKFQQSDNTFKFNFGNN